MPLGHPKGRMSDIEYKLKSLVSKQKSRVTDCICKSFDAKTYEELYVKGKKKVDMEIQYYTSPEKEEKRRNAIILSTKTKKCLRNQIRRHIVCLYIPNNLQKLYVNSLNVSKCLILISCKTNH